MSPFLREAAVQGTSPPSWAGGQVLGAVWQRLMSPWPAGFCSPRVYLCPAAPRVPEHHCPDPAGEGQRALGASWGPLWRAAGESVSFPVRAERSLWETGIPTLLLSCCKLGKAELPRASALSWALGDLQEKVWSQDRLMDRVFSRHCCPWGTAVTFSTIHPHSSRPASCTSCVLCCPWTRWEPWHGGLSCQGL